jgi:hypothetical protein
MKKISTVLFALLLLSKPNYSAEITGELKQWHKVTLTFTGPKTSETATPNPFLDYRLQVDFKHSKTGTNYSVPGYFAADGNTANTSADSGSKWRVHFSPDAIGEWMFTVCFRKGLNVAVSEEENPGTSATFMDGETGAFSISASDKSGRDFRAKGRLQYVGERYLRFAGNGEYFLKAGADAPENLLSYADFDGDFKKDSHKDDLVKNWEPHVQDWRPGDPTWQNGKGKGLIGAVNYLASKGMNAMSFLPMNIIGDDQNVFPYITYDERSRIDVSRLDQWEIVFEHAQKMGIFLHFKTQEAENQNLLDGGDLGVQRKLYYRELIARFGHHLALNWNLGEENGTWGKDVKGQSSEQRRAMAQYFHNNDPYRHHIVIHNGQWFDDLYGDQSRLTGVSLQTHRPDFSLVHSLTLQVLNESEKAGKVWAVACDEPGDASHALVPDLDNPNHDSARQNALWGVLTAGGWGIEWYFGYNHAHSDLTCQDWRSRDRMWQQSCYALDFFKNYQIPFWSMYSNDSLSHSQDWILASPWDENPYWAVIYNRGGGECVFDLPDGSFDYGWFNPHSGIGLSTLVQEGSIEGMKESILSAPDSRDWILLIGPRGKLAPKDVSLAPEVIELFAFYDFALASKDNYVPAYRDKNNRALALDAAQYQDKFAAGELSFPGASGTYDIIITTMTETDGESSYHLFVNGKKVGEFQNPETDKDYEKVQHRWTNVIVKHGDEILVAFNSHSNGNIPENDTYAYSRGRWRSLAFVKPGAAYIPFVDLDWEEPVPEIDTSYFIFDFNPGEFKKKFNEREGLLVVEGEHFAKQSYHDVRKWHLTTTTQTPGVVPDPDENHAQNASGGAYLEILPDSRANHSERLIQNENFTEDPGRMAVLYYPVYFNTPGKYYVWVRSCPTGSEDNGLHVGIDGEWPASGRRMQWISQNSQWQWDSKQRTQLVHTGVPYRIYLEVKEPGLHTIMFSMREDGFEMDKWLMSTDKDILKHGQTGMGPDESPTK